MMAGSRLIAPEGCGELVKGTEYHFLISDGGCNRVRLVEFDTKGTSAKLHTMTRLRFEAALEDGEIVETGSHDYPPWLKAAAGIETKWRESSRISPKQSYEEKVDDRLLKIAELIPKRAEILASEDPEAIINAHARASKPRQHPARIRLWFFTYLVFGQTKWALMPRFEGCGKWDRSGKIDKKLGRPSGNGQNHGYPVTPDMKEKILAGFLKHKRVDKTKDEIYGDSLRKTFGCRVRENSSGKEFYHPGGEPFPSFTQFWNWVQKQTDPAPLAQAMIGPSAARAKSGDTGTFAQMIGNLNQVLEFDGYYPSEKISGFIEGAPLDSFCVVRAVCELSGAVVGIGFARGRESLEAYRMALFCIAIGKVKYCELFGMNIKHEEWPCVGLSNKMVFDRGPGVHLNVSQAQEWLSRLEATPTHRGQAKATVEASHPRDKQFKDEPVYAHSGLNLVEMSRRELRRVLKDNENSDASERMDGDMWLEGFSPTPLNIWEYHNALGRNHGINMSFEQAVREFLTPMPAVIRKGGVFFFGRKYNSKSLTETGIFDRVAKDGVISVIAYSMTMCVRHIWIEVEGRLYELSFVYTASTRPDSGDISLEDLQFINESRLQAQAKRRNEKVAIEQYHYHEFEKDTGKEWHAGVRKLGSPAKSQETQRDIDDQRRLLGNKS
ncbi:transposase [Pseudomonas asiatica]|uniref:transposase n=1 Tax=Pseudomonas asiatica TaxID=2219225 RepID=UPI002E7C0080|nr:transposase [Pseudomonas asiatica]MEE1915998.1 transposase [Pseudomonas asiatica]